MNQLKSLRHGENPIHTGMLKPLIFDQNEQEYRSTLNFWGNPYLNTHYYTHICMGLFTSRTSMPSIFQFSQDAVLKEALLGTEGTTMVEAAPRDTVWGIGLGAKNPKAMNRQQWRGKNWLGEILTQVREEIMEASKRETTNRDHTEM